MTNKELQDFLKQYRDDEIVYIKLRFRNVELWDDVGTIRGGKISDTLLPVSELGIILEGKYYHD